ncbi:MAG TPA: thiosulfate sulfurtransferase GlpE [Candidatus Binatia bacterium]|jgi:thiosulfate sulfurtransferase|nr:thiosulfate sulfurtransferase GlpE [Candidatus Binatia bacterium]
MEVPQIQIQDAKNKLDGKECLFIDIRDPGSYEEAHIPGAIRLHDGNVQEFLQSANKSKEVIVYCYHGNSSLGATAFLIENGFTNVASMSGGFEAWRQVYEHE